MYIPNWFLEESVPKLQEFMRAYSFGVLVTNAGCSPFASHLPFLLDPSRGTYGTLRGHMARANPQWRDFTDASDALVIFHGPHAYISPSWYETFPAVPTWNYAAVHAYGVARCVEPPILRQILLDTVKTFDGAESRRQLPEEYFEKMVNGVVGFEIEVTRLEGKFKLSQNRSDADRRSVIRELESSGRTEITELAALMEIAPAYRPQQ